MVTHEDNTKLQGKMYILKGLFARAGMGVVKDDGACEVGLNV